MSQNALVWDDNAHRDIVRKRLTSNPAPVESVKALFAHYPGIEDKVTIPEFMKARQEVSEERFKRVEPMVGAAKLVRHLVRRRRYRRPLPLRVIESQILATDVP